MEEERERTVQAERLLSWAQKNIGGELVLVWQC